ncbi:MAG: hypothetical protein JWN14_1468 [Chthonomonadales bacterium]|nr:hypothetical protein [Chthonomonadales bacterium]
MIERNNDFYNSKYGIYSERLVAQVFRSIGYLVRLSVNKGQIIEVDDGLRFLRQCYLALAPNEDRSIVVGLTTALGVIGDWEPILFHLTAEEPWMHEAAFNVCTLWVPTPLDTSSDDEQREGIVRWIVGRLYEHQDLPPQVRSTLERIKDNLETKLGRHISRNLW